MDRNREDQFENRYCIVIYPIIESFYFAGRHLNQLLTSGDGDDFGDSTVPEKRQIAKPIFKTGASVQLVACALCECELGIKITLALKRASGTASQ
jgi:hypothetical protein